MIRPLMITLAAASVLAITAGAGVSKLHAAEPGRPKDAASVATRNFAWKAGPELKIGFPAEVSYVQGSESSMVATGSPAMLDALKVKDGQIRLDISCLTRCYNQPPLRINITAPSTHAFEASGAAHLDIRNYDQPQLKLAVSGAATARAAGKAGKLDLAVSGAGHADLGDLASTDAKVGASGASHATLRATGKVEAAASGASSVTLKVRPQSLKQNVSGASHVVQP